MVVTVYINQAILKVGSKRYLSQPLPAALLLPSFFFCRVLGPPRAPSVSRFKVVSNTLVSHRILLALRLASVLWAALLALLAASKFLTDLVLWRVLVVVTLLALLAEQYLLACCWEMQVLLCSILSLGYQLVLVWLGFGIFNSDLIFLSSSSCFFQMWWGLVGVTTEWIVEMSVSINS